MEINELALSVKYESKKKVKWKMVKLVEQKHEILTPIGVEMLKMIERIGRVCYKSEDKITDDSYIQFVQMIVKRQHFSVIEHCSVTVWFQTERGVTHELVRHRLVSVSQESTRYCNYSKGKFGGEIAVIDKKGYLPGEFSLLYPPSNEKDEPRSSNYTVWKMSMDDAEHAYQMLIGNGISPQIARGVLPNDLKTEIIVTANLREWGHIFKLRSSANEGAHPCMKALIDPVLAEFRARLPIIFDDLSGF